MKTYTENEVQQIIRDATTAAAEGMFNWFASPDVWIQDKTTLQRIENCELACNKDVSPTRNYIYPLLAEKGIKFIPED